jgi:hypothetical protein
VVVEVVPAQWVVLGLLVPVVPVVPDWLVVSQAYQLYMVAVAAADPSIVVALLAVPAGLVAAVRAGEIIQTAQLELLIAVVVAVAAAVALLKAPVVLEAVE